METAHILSVLALVLAGVLGYLALKMGYNLDFRLGKFFIFRATRPRRPG